MRNIKINDEIEVTYNQAKEWYHDNEKTIFICDTYSVSCNERLFSKIEDALETICDEEKFNEL